MKEVFEAIKKHLNDNGFDCVRRGRQLSNGQWSQEIRLRDKKHKMYGCILPEHGQGGNVVRFRYKTKSRNKGHKVLDMSDPKSIDKLTSLAKSKRALYELGYDL